MTRFTKNLGVGPWFYTDNVSLINPMYRGKPMTFRGNLAAGNTGTMMIELIQQSDNEPTMFTEVINKKGYGLHHHGIAVHSFDAEVKKYVDRGCEIAFYAETNIPNRNAYIDTRGELPFFIELIEATPNLEAIFGRVYHDSIGWDGKNPVRDFGSLLS
jgi:hypothetical protein